MRKRIIRFCEWMIKACKPGYRPWWVHNIDTWVFYRKIALHRVLGLRNNRMTHIDVLMRAPQYYNHLGTDGDKYPCIETFCGYLYFTDGIRDIMYREPDYNNFLSFNIAESVVTWHYYRKWLKEFRLLQIAGPEADKTIA